MPHKQYSPRALPQYITRAQAMARGTCICRIVMHHDVGSILLHAVRKMYRLSSGGTQAPSAHISTKINDATESTHDFCMYVRRSHVSLCNCNATHFIFFFSFSIRGCCIRIANSAGPCRLISSQLLQNALVFSKIDEQNANFLRHIRVYRVRRQLDAGTKHAFRNRILSS